VIAYDLPSHGRSSAPPQATTPTQTYDINPILRMGSLFASLWGTAARLALPTYRTRRAST
jgi:hypothetical protein